MKRKSKSRRNAIRASSDEGLEKAAQLAPLEERAPKSDRQNSNNSGVILIDSGKLKLPKDFTEQGEGRSGLFGLEPITIVILTFALAFIGLMTYLISVEPPKAKDEPPPTVESPR